MSAPTFVWADPPAIKEGRPAVLVRRPGEERARRCERAYFEGVGTVLYDAEPPPGLPHVYLVVHAHVRLGGEVPNE